jgi:hypothetical protein
MFFYFYFLKLNYNYINIYIFLLCFFGEFLLNNYDFFIMCLIFEKSFSDSFIIFFIFYIDELYF